MTEYITSKASHYTPAASLAALGVKRQQVKVFEPIERLVHIAQKTVNYSPLDKLYDGFITMLAGAHGMVEINTRLRSDPALRSCFLSLQKAKAPCQQRTAMIN